MEEAVNMAEDVLFLVPKRQDWRTLADRLYVLERLPDVCQGETGHSQADEHGLHAQFETPVVFFSSRNSASEKKPIVFYALVIRRGKGRTQRRGVHVLPKEHRCRLNVLLFRRRLKRFLL